MGKIVITKSRREDFPFGKIWVAKFTDEVSRMGSQMSFAEVRWLMRKVPMQRQLTS